MWEIHGNTGNIQEIYGYNNFIRNTYIYIYIYVCMYVCMYVCI